MAHKSSISQLRTNESHMEDVSSLQQSTMKSVRGVSEFSLLFSINSLDVTDLPHDPMHIIFEGVGKYHVIDFLQVLLDGSERTRTSIKEINMRIGGFDYGPYKKRNKPLAIMGTILNDTASLRWTSSMTSTFIMFLPFILFDIVDIEHEYFGFFNLLRKIVQIISSRRITDGMIAMLKECVDKYCTIYTNSETLSNVPKIHYLKHLPDQIKR